MFVNELLLATYHTNDLPGTSKNTALPHVVHNVSLIILEHQCSLWVERFR